MDTSRSNPRRRQFLNAPVSSYLHRAEQPLNATPVRISAPAQSLRKGSTFHSPTSPRSAEHDPILSVPSLPRRSPTCFKQLEASIASEDSRIAQLIGAVDRSLSGLGSFCSDSQETVVSEALPVPRFLVDNAMQDDESIDVDSCWPTRSQRSHRKHHASDSGIGSTETSERSAIGDDACLKRGADQVGLAKDTSSSFHVGRVKTGINGNSAMAALSGVGSQHALSEYACRQIQKHIILPIIREDRLKSFHPLVGGLPARVARREITCLRDLEKVLLWLAPKWSVSKTSFLLFCETSIQCIHTTVEYLSENEQRRPTDRPYTQGYFLDLVEQVRQYAAMLSSTKARAISDTAQSDDGSDEERLHLVGGLSQTGKPAELVRVKDGKSISLRTGEEVSMDEYQTGSKRAVEEISDEDALRSMARRKKSAGTVAKEEHRCRECNKAFKRPCDLTKHEKTHSRPWKCSEANCKYHEYGWPTEKERDRHVNDKHSAAPAMFKCRFHPCPYESKRDSNCKQHMEKAHGWVYVRSKNNGKNSNRPSNARAPPTPQESTPGSYIFSAPTPDLSENAAFTENDEAREDQLQMEGLPTDFADAFPQDMLSTFGEIFGPADGNFSWTDTWTEHRAVQQGENSTDSSRASWDPGYVGPTILQSTFEDQSLFGSNFDWSNMNRDLTSLNPQLATPAASVDHHPTQTFSRTASVSLDRSPQTASHPSLSPGGQGDAMLYSPFSAPSNDMSVDEGYNDFTQDLVARPTRDFNLFDPNNMSAIGVHGEFAMFGDLATLPGANGWSEKGIDLHQQLDINDHSSKMEE